MNQQCVVRVTTNDNPPKMRLTKTVFNGDDVETEESFVATAVTQSGERCWYFSKEKFLPNSTIGKRIILSASRYVVWSIDPL